MTSVRSLVVASLFLLIPLVGAAAADGAPVSVELNKLEPTETGCQSYLVIRNTTDLTYTEFNLEVLVFDTDGIIQKRLAMDLAPVRAGKTTVFIAGLAGMECGAVGEVLLNSFLDCSAEGERVADCIDRVELSSRADARLFK